MRVKLLFKYLAALTLALLAVGCAKTNVRATNQVAYTGLPRPDRVLIYNFAVTPADIQENSSIFAKIGRNIENKNQTADEIKVGVCSNKMRAVVVESRDMRGDLCGRRYGLDGPARLKFFI